MLAISERSAGVRALARALPPFLPPLAACSCEAVISSSDSSPDAMSTISFASWFGSRGRLGLAVILIIWRCAGRFATHHATRPYFQTDPLPEIGYEAGSLGYDAMMQRDWSKAEAKLAASRDELGDDPARLLNLAEVYRQTGRADEAEALYAAVLSAEDMKLVLADGRVVTAHGIASSRLSTTMQASR